MTASPTPSLNHPAHRVQRSLHGFSPSMRNARNPNPLVGRGEVGGEIDPPHGLAIMQNLAVIGKALASNCHGSVRPHRQNIAGTSVQVKAGAMQ